MPSEPLHAFVISKLANGFCNGILQLVHIVLGRRIHRNKHCRCNSAKMHMAMRFGDQTETDVVRVTLRLDIVGCGESADE